MAVITPFLLSVAVGLTLNMNNSSALLKPANYLLTKLLIPGWSRIIRSADFWPPSITCVLLASRTR